MIMTEVSKIDFVQRTLFLNNASIRVSTFFEKLSLFLSFVFFTHSETTGSTIASITIAIDVPNKADPDSILLKLKKISQASNTNSNRGLRDLVTAGKKFDPVVFSVCCNGIGQHRIKHK
jgi:hypothetical protein